MSQPFKIRVKTIGLTGASGSKYLSGLLDVLAVNVANNDIVFWDSGISKFRVANVSNINPYLTNNRVPVRELTGNYTIQNTDSGSMFYSNTSGNTFIFLPANIEYGTYFSVTTANVTGSVIIKTNANSHTLYANSVSGFQTIQTQVGPFVNTNVTCLRRHPSSGNTEWVIR